MESEGAQQFPERREQKSEARSHLLSPGRTTNPHEKNLSSKPERVARGRGYDVFGPRRSPRREKPSSALCSVQRQATIKGTPFFEFYQWSRRVSRLVRIESSRTRASPLSRTLSAVQIGNWKRDRDTSGTQIAACRRTQTRSWTRTRPSRTASCASARQRPTTVSVENSVHV